jgi:hypothetical protein
VGAIQSYLDGQVGDVSSNEYFEVENKDSIALPTGITPSSASSRASGTAAGRFSEAAPPPA